jgi:hypothetical protein
MLYCRDYGRHSSHFYNLKKVGKWGFSLNVENNCNNNDTNYYYGPPKVIRVTLLNTYQLTLGDDTVKVDLIHQVSLKWSIIPEGRPFPKRPWCSKRNNKDKTTSRSNAGVLPAPVSSQTTTILGCQQHRPLFVKSKHLWLKFLLSKQVGVI